MANTPEESRAVWWIIGVIAVVILLWANSSADGNRNIGTGTRTTHTQTTAYP